MIRACRVASDELCCLDHVDIKDCYKKIRAFEAKTQADKREWLSTVVSSGDASQLSTSLPHSRPLCAKCFQKYHGVKRTFYYSILAKVLLIYILSDSENITCFSVQLSDIYILQYKEYKTCFIFRHLI